MLPFSRIKSRKISRSDQIRRPVMSGCRGSSSISSSSKPAILPRSMLSESFKSPIFDVGVTSIRSGMASSFFSSASSFFFLSASAAASSPGGARSAVASERGRETRGRRRRVRRRSLRRRGERTPAPRPPRSRPPPAAPPPPPPCSALGRPSVRPRRSPWVSVRRGRHARARELSSRARAPRRRVNAFEDDVGWAAPTRGSAERRPLRRRALRTTRATLCPTTRSGWLIICQVRAAPAERSAARQ